MVFPNAVFLHFMDSYHWKFAVRVRQHLPREVAREMAMAFRVAFLASDNLYISASAFMENPVARQVLRAHRELGELGHIKIVGSDGSLAEHNLLKREAHYRDTNEPEVAKAYEQRIRLDIPYVQEALDVRAGVRRVWDSEQEDPARHFLSETHDGSYALWERVPELLEGRAFVAPHILELFARHGQSPPSTQSMYRIVDAGYALAHAVPLQAGLVGDLVFLHLSDEKLLRKAPIVSYERATRLLSRSGLLEMLRNCPPSELITLRTTTAVRDALRQPPTSQPFPADEMLPFSQDNSHITIKVKELHVGDKFDIHHIRESKLNVGSHNKTIKLRTDSDAADALSQLIKIVYPQDTPAELRPVQQALEAGDKGSAKSLWSSAKEVISTSDAFVKAGKGAVELYEAIANFFSG